MNKAEVRAMAEVARRMPAREAEYRNLILNQRIEINSPFLAADVWKACGAEPRDLHGCRVFAGLDLSATTDLTALVLAGQDPLEGTWSVVPYFWLPAEGLAERARSDRVPYDTWAAKVSSSSRQAHRSRTSSSLTASVSSSTRTKSSASRSIDGTC